MSTAAEKKRQEKRRNESWAPPLLPVEPLKTDATRWMPADRKQLVWRLGNRASIEEITKTPDRQTQRWRWRLCAFGGGTAITATLEAAMRAAEFALGIGEMPVGGWC